MLNERPDTAPDEEKRGIAMKAAVFYGQEDLRVE